MANVNINRFKKQFTTASKTATTTATVNPWTTRANWVNWDSEVRQKIANEDLKMLPRNLITTAQLAQFWNKAVKQVYVQNLTDFLTNSVNAIQKTDTSFESFKTSTSSSVSPFSEGSAISKASENTSKNGRKMPFSNSDPAIQTYVNAVSSNVIAKINALKKRKIRQEGRQNKSEEWSWTDPDAVSVEGQYKFFTEACWKLCRVFCIKYSHKPDENSTKTPMYWGIVPEGFFISLADFRNIFTLDRMYQGQRNIFDSHGYVTDRKPVVAPQAANPGDSDPVGQSRYANNLMTFICDMLNYTVGCFSYTASSVNTYDKQWLSMGCGGDHTRGDFWAYSESNAANRFYSAYPGATITDIEWDNPFHMTVYGYKYVVTASNYSFAFDNSHFLYPMKPSDWFVAR